MPILSQQDITEVLNPTQQHQTTVKTLPGTDMIGIPPTTPKPFTAKISDTEPQPGTSQEHKFGPDAPQLPIAPEDILTHAHELLKRHAPAKTSTDKETPQIPTPSTEETKEKEIEIIEDDNDDNDDDKEEEDTEGKEEPQYIKKGRGKAVPHELQNPKRSYCECGHSYMRSSDLKCHKLECRKPKRYPWVCPKCPSKFMHHHLKENTSTKST